MSDHGHSIKRRIQKKSLKRQMLAHAERRCIGNRKPSRRVFLSKLGGTLLSGKSPQILQPPFLAAKKDTTAKRMVGKSCQAK